MNTDEYMKELRKINNELRWDYYMKHKSRIIKRILNALAIDYKNFFKYMSLKDLDVAIFKFIFVWKEELENIRSKFRKN